MAGNIAVAESNHLLAQQIHRQIDSLPEESLLEIVTFLEYLNFKSGKAIPNSQTKDAVRVVNLRGIAKGHDFSPELLAEVRREMWGAKGASA